MRIDTKWFTTDVEVFASDYNGTVVRFNPSHQKAAILSTDLAFWRSLLDDFDAALEQFYGKKRIGERKLSIPFFKAARAAATVEGIAKAFETHLLAHHKDRHSRTRALFIRLLLVAYDKGAILLPLGCAANTCEWLGVKANLYPVFEHRLTGLFPKISPFIQTMTRSHVPADGKRQQAAILLAMTLREPADASQALVDRFWAAAYQGHKGFQTKDRENRFRSIASQLLWHMENVIRLEHPGGQSPHYSVTLVERRAYRDTRRERYTTFDWLREKTPDLSAWADALKEHLANLQVRRVVTKEAYLRPLAEYLVALPVHERPSHPGAFDRRYVIRRDGSPSLTLVEYLRRKKTDLVARRVGMAASQFFDDWHDQQRGLPDWRNPIRETDLPAPPAPAVKTNKEAVPIRVIRIMKELIVADDFAWPRSLDGDYFERLDPETGRYERIWSPVRVIALLVLLTVPLRSVQVRLLDSGEGDEIIYNHESHTWVPNPLRTVRKKCQNGAIRRFYDADTGREIVGLWVNTNKTATADPRVDRGYGIPWQNEELIGWLDYLAKWQRRYNPKTRPIARDELIDSDLHLVSDDLRGKLPRYFYLFRDPANKEAPPDNPVSKSRLDIVFRLALAAVEEKLQKEDSSVKLTFRYEGTGTITRTVFSLHGLRVAGITHFLQAGVPIQVLAEFVAGHATLLMTLHYTKFGPSYITDVIDKAAELMESEADENWARFIADLPKEQLLDHVVSNDAAGIDELADSRPGLWSIQLDGICPVGKSLCHIGGPKLAQNSATYAPVPGGPRNCARCRFFITGPVFLHGQVVAFNTLVFAIGEKVKDLDRIRKSLAALRAAGASRSKIIRDQDRADGLEIELDEMLCTLQARFQLIEKSRALLKTRNAAAAKTAGFDLITLGDEKDFEFVIEQTRGDFDLLEFVAQACQVFPEKAEPSARLRKGRIMDAFLLRNGYQPFLCALPEDEALAAANQITRFLQEKIGRDGVRNLVAGQETLESIGLEREFDSMQITSSVLNVSGLLRQTNGTVPKLTDGRVDEA